MTRKSIISVIVVIAFVAGMLLSIPAVDALAPWAEDILTRIGVLENTVAVLQTEIDNIQTTPGPAGISCWDTDGDGVNDPSEDTNQDTNYNTQDCQGQAGANGIACWDLDGDGIGDPSEDRNNDLNFNALDCQGTQGTPGPSEWVNQPPVVNAGPDQTTSNFIVTVSATVTDTTIPGILTGSWIKVSGPIVIFDSINSATTEVTLLGPGTYVLRYTANDGLLSGSDTVQITVN